MNDSLAKIQVELTASEGLKLPVLNENLSRFKLRLNVQPASEPESSESASAEKFYHKEVLIVLSASPAVSDAVAGGLQLGRTLTA